MSISIARDTSQKIAKLRKATVATEKLLFGDLADSPCRAVLQPDLAALKLRLAKLSMVFELDCVELAKILTSNAKLLLDSKPVDYAALEPHAPKIGNRIATRIRSNRSDAN